MNEGVNKFNVFFLRHVADIPFSKIEMDTYSCMEIGVASNIKVSLWNILLVYSTADQYLAHEITVFTTRVTAKH